MYSNVVNYKSRAADDDSLFLRFIQEVGKTLGLRHDTMATASVYFHRFYMFHSFLEFPRYVNATCALFLAGKAEETPKKCRDLIKTVRSLTNDHQFSFFGVVSIATLADAMPCYPSELLCVTSV